MISNWHTTIPDAFGRKLKLDEASVAEPRLWLGHRPDDRVCLGIKNAKQLVEALQLWITRHEEQQQ